MDKRVYNGCPNDELREHLENIQKHENLLKRKFPESCVTYFPVENMWMVHEWGNPLSSLHKEKLNAILEALQKEKIKWLNLVSLKIF